MRLRRIVLGLAALSFCGPLMSAQGPAGPAADLFARNRILQVEIQMAPEDWRAARLEHRTATDETLSEIAEDAYEYRRGDVVIDGVRVAQVGVRKKGFFGSVVSTRPSLKIKFDEYVDGQSFAGLDGLTLNNNNSDQTFVQQVLTYDLFARVGVAAPRAGFAHVRVNGEDLGIYTHVEAINKAFLRRVFGRDNGVLYESYAGDFTAWRLSRIVEKSGGRNQDRSAPGALRDVLAAAGPVSLARVEALVDLDSFMKMWAVESLIGHWDSYSGNRNNYYLYANPATRKLHFIPWGADQVFADPGPLQAKIVPKSFKAEGVLARRLWELPEIRGRYRELMRMLLAEPWTESRLLADTEALQQMLLPQSTLMVSTVRAASERAATFIAARRAEVEAELVGPGPEWPSGPAVAPTLASLSVSGSFAAPWTAVLPSDPFASGSGTLQVQIEGKPPVTFERVSAFAVTHAQTGARPAPIREKYQNVTLTGRAGTEVWQVSLTIDPFLFAAGPGALPVDHYAVWAILSVGDGTKPPRVRNFGNVGELRLDEASARAGGVLRGAFTLRALEF